ncbi:hypothetical protein CDA63_06760 [Hymenobacter amundsenii]|uniref:Uncharacterized protein n=1 Tax=Hymenobacter amundsenii TaxID=2006685 RepID=A0A246FMC7_9BACT|nr:hypothetical protein [Hymenobacter amundsenii]OWP63907.1 hypothetical protein CDA63_06760 [Hymenobacter amundsenii]
MSAAESYSSQVWRFFWAVVVPNVPRVAWLVLGLAVFCWLNLLGLEELWPHFPQAERWFVVVLVVNLGLLPWLGARTAQLVRQRVQGWWWQGFWQMVAFVAYLGATALSILLLIFGLLVGLM